MARKSRAIIVGTNAYHYLMLYWLERFQTVWRDEVDRVYIAVSRPVHPTNWPKTKALLQSDKKITVIETNTDWPNSITAALGAVNEESVGIWHDDLFVMKKGVVDSLFSVVEGEGKVVTPIHDNFTPPDLVKELMQHKWGSQLPLVEEGTGREGYAFFCNFFFCPRELLRKTRQNFGTLEIKKGEQSELLNHLFLTTGVYADTNFLLGLELLEAGAKFYCPREYDLQTYLPRGQNRLKTLKTLKNESSELFDLPYLHFQTFSYHIEGLYLDVGVREALEKIRGDAVPRPIENLPANVATRNDITLKLAAINNFMKPLEGTRPSEYDLHALREIDYIEKYLKISQRELDGTTKLLAEVLYG